MLHFRRIAAIANATLLLMAGLAVARPNVVVVSGDFGAEGKPAALERLRGDGISFGKAFAAPTPTATLASWLTGSHPFKAGVVHVRGGRNFIRPETPLVSDLFRAAGYRTAFGGVWGLGESLPFRPEDRGFQDVWLEGAGAAWDRWNNSSSAPWLRNRGGWLAGQGTMASALTSEATKWLQERVEAKEPFFLHINLGKGDEAAAVDLLATLDRLGVADSTIVVALGTVGRASGNDPEPMIPLVIRVPGQKSASIETPVAAFDGMLTLASLCGVPLFKDWQGDGIDLTPMINGTASVPSARSFFFHSGGWPADQKADRYQSDGFVVRKDRWRLSGLELWDLSQPANARRDLFEENPKIADELMKDYGAWWQSVRQALADPARIIVGDERQKAVTLTWGDWWPSRESLTAVGADAYPDQATLKDLLAKLADPEKANTLPSISGQWKLHAARAGNYRLTLSKLSPDAPKEERTRVGQLKEGEAHARSGKYEVKALLLKGATSISVSVDLNEGPVDLEAWFENQTGEKKILGAFYATIERVGERKMPDTDWKAQPQEKK